MSSKEVIKSVAKQLKYYMDVQRREDGFDLSDSSTPRLDHPPHKPHPTLQYSQQRPLKHYYSLPEVKGKPTHMRQKEQSGRSREKDVKQQLKVYMANTEYNTTTLPDYYYVQTRHGKRLIPEAIPFRGPARVKRKRTLKGGWPILRTVPPHDVSRAEATRLVNVAARLLIATETLEKENSESRSKSPTPIRRTSRQPGAPKSFESNRSPSDDRRSSLQHDRGSRLSTGKRRQRPLTASLIYDINASKGKGFSDSYDSAYNTESPKGGSHWTRHERRNEDSSSSISSDTKRPQKKLSPHGRPYSAKLPRTRPDSSKYKVKRTGPNILSPEPDIYDDVVINEGTQTQDSVGIQTEKRLLDNFDPLDVEVLQGEVIEYEVNVRTGTRIGASSNADVKLTIYGENGRTKEFPLLNSTRHKVKFQKGKDDQFYVSAPHVGKLKKVKIGHDRTDLSYAWFLEGVTISDTHDRRVYEFPCERWLSGQDGDKRTYRELYLDRERGMIDEGDTDSELSEPEIPTTKKNNNDFESDTKKRFIIEKPEESYSNDDTESVQAQHSQHTSDSEESESESESDSDSSSYKHGNKNIVPVASDSERSRSVNESHKTKEERTSTERQSPVGQQNDEPFGTTRKDDFFDQRPARPSYTFLVSSDVNSNKPEYSESEKQAPSTTDSVIDSGYLAGYKAGIETSLNESKPEKDDEAKNVLQGQTIHEAAKVGNLERMQLLSLHYPKLKESSNEVGWTPLHVATAQGQTEVVKWLSGAIVELNKETPTGFTAIHIAAQNGHVNCMMVLFAMGASITCRTIDSQTPLHLAASRGHLECVKWLVANRANLDALDSFGRNPRNMAEEFEKEEVAAFLGSCQKEFANPNSTFHQLHSSEKTTDPSPTDNVDQSYEEPPVWIDRKATESRSSVSQHATAGSDEESGSESETTTSSQPDPELQEKKKMYDEQHSMMERTGTSFLDSIRQELDQTS